MKKSIIFLGMLGFSLSYAQKDNNGKVGVNTETPSATLNVKSKIGTTSATKNLELENANSEKLVTVLDNGNVGVGITTPTTKLDLVSNAEKTAFRMADGSQGEDKVLTSDENGNAAWKNNSLNAIEGVFGAGANIPYNTRNWINTGTTITLPANSKYLVMVTLLLAYENFEISNGTTWVRTMFTDTPDAQIPTVDAGARYLISGSHNSNAKYSLLSGSLVLHNTSNTPKTYYYMAGDIDNINNSLNLINVGGGWLEGSMVAFPIK